MKEMLNHTSPKEDNLNSTERKYPNMNTGFYLSEDEIEHLGKVFLEWTKKDKKAFKCGDFFIERGWSLDAVEYWNKKNPAFKSLYEAGKYTIGSRRERNYKREYDSAVVSRTLHFYDPQYKKDHREDVEHKAKVLNPQTTGDTKIVVIEKFGEE